MSRNRTTMELKGDREIVITRTFDAPPDIVFEAWTKPDFVRRWWAPKTRAAIVSVDADIRVGGKYRYVIRPHGTPMDIAFSGVYREIAPHTRLVYTQTFEPMAHAGEVVVTIAFKDVAGKTLMTSHELYPSAEVRSAAVSSGMEDGMRETMDQLDDLVASRA